MQTTKAVAHISRGEELRAWLLNAYEEYKRSGAVSYHADVNEVNKYSHLEMARKFADVLNEAVHKSEDAS